MKSTHKSARFAFSDSCSACDQVAGEACGAHDRYSTLNWACLLTHKSNAGQALRRLEAFGKEHGVAFLSGHADNALEFIGKNTEAQQFFDELASELRVIPKKKVAGFLYVQDSAEGYTGDWREIEAKIFCSAPWESPVLNKF